MYLKGLELLGFKSFAKKSELSFASPIAGIVGPNGSGKSNIAEAFRFVLGEQSFKSMRGKRGEDLLWGGSRLISRANRASIKAIFDNTSRLFDIDFDEVTIERTVYRDGINEYVINGSRVRLKDIVELLAHANIGSTGHHIISQGEADILLSANVRERREMVEDALGLKIFQYKKKESERKLEHTAENIAHVVSLRKEIAPHVRFLKKQVEKIEKSQRLREELKKLLREYLKREELYIKHAQKNIESRREEPRKKLLELEKKLEDARAVLEKTAAPNNRGREVLNAEEKLSAARAEREELSREIGRLEGQLSFAEKYKTESVVSGISLSDARTLEKDIEDVLKEAERDETVKSFKGVLKKIRTLLASFFEKYPDTASRESAVSLEELKAKKTKLDARFKDIEQGEKETGLVYKRLQEEIETSKDKGRDAERNVFRIIAEKNKVEGILDGLARDEEALRQIEAEFKRDMAEGAALAGRDALEYASVAVSSEEVQKETRGKQEERKRMIEKIKIRVEEFGGSSGDEVLKEYREVSERDQFLEREIADLERSADTLKQLIAELNEKLAVRFEEGVKKINKEFQHFFALLFGGGTASLKVLEEKKQRHAGLDIDESNNEVSSESGNEEETETGIDILVSLPRKKTKGLQMLSGGERALTSIALLFAMSQVNPPPFLVLDETDAALDEANSRKYSAMIKDLAKKTQLILITHNRETMSIAGVLYGVTMGSDGMSKLLSVKFEEAVVVAK